MQKQLTGARIINSYEDLKIEPTFLTSNSSTCIDLIFKTQINSVMISGIHSPLHTNCHHQIVFAKINLKVCYPPPYECEIWHYDC